MKCAECGEELLGPFIMRSSAGHYVGHECPACGPYDRISDYFKNLREAEAERRHIESGI